MAEPEFQNGQVAPFQNPEGGVQTLEVEEQRPEVPVQTFWPTGVRPLALEAEDEALPAEPPPPILYPPMSWEALYQMVLVLDTHREVAANVDQSIPAGGTGSVTVTIGTGTDKVDIQKFFDEDGDAVVSYEVEVDNPTQIAVPEHRISSGKRREFMRYWQKYTTVTFNYTNNDAVNAARLQIMWASVQLDRGQWLGPEGLLARLATSAVVQGIPA